MAPTRPCGPAATAPRCARRGRAAGRPPGPAGRLTAQPAWKRRYCARNTSISATVCRYGVLPPARPAPLFNCPGPYGVAGCSSAEGRTVGDRACLDSVHGAMGNPGRRRRSGRHRWLRALISRGRPSEESAAGLLAEPAEFGWPGHSDAERPADDPADGWRADPAAYQWLGDWTDEPAPRRLLDGLPDSDWPAEPAASTRFAGHGTGPGLHGRRRAGPAGWAGSSSRTGTWPWPGTAGTWRSARALGRWPWPVG